MVHLLTVSPVRMAHSMCKTIDYLIIILSVALGAALVGSTVYGCEYGCHGGTPGARPSRVRLEGFYECDGTILIHDVAPEAPVRPTSRIVWA